MFNVRALAFCIFIALNAFNASAYGQDRQHIIPIDTFASLPSFSGAKLSPSGKKIAYFVENEGKRNLVVGNIDGSKPLLVPPPKKQTFISFRWKGDTTIIYTTNLSIKRRSKMIRTAETRLRRLDLNTGTTRWLGAPDRTNLRETESQHERIVSLLPQDPDHILIELDLNRNDTYEVYQSNLDSGHRKPLNREQDGIQYWVSDTSGNVRLSYGFLGNKRVSLMKMPDGNWSNLSDLVWTAQYQVEGFTENPSIVYVSGANERGLKSLYTLDTSTGAIVDTLFSHADVDMDQPVISQHTGSIVGVTYIDNFKRSIYFDKVIAKIQHSIDLAMPGTVNTIVNYSYNREQFLVFAQDSLNPGDYYIYHKSNGTLSYVAPVRSNLNKQQSSGTEALSIPMTDGAKIPAYLTLPKKFKVPQSLPAVIMPHSRPFDTRDDASWDYEAQFYASRGYVVLKPNFRGSSGYGKAFLKAGLNQWGGLMQSDISDATRWLIKQGYADPDRICIVGTSYGGYAALMGAILEPNLYKCAASINGITDLPRMKDNDRIYTIGGRTSSQHWGLQGENDKTVSPYHHAEDINVPVLLMASQDDARIPFRLSEDMHKKLKKLGKKSRFVPIKNGAHDMVTAQARRTKLTHMERFLNKHIGEGSVP